MSSHHFYEIFERTFKRTEGISTTDIVGRLLLMTKSHHFESGFEETKKLRKMSGEEGIAVNNIKEEHLIDVDKTAKTGFLLKIFEILKADFQNMSLNCRRSSY